LGVFAGANDFIQLSGNAMAEAFKPNGKPTARGRLRGWGRKVGPALGWAAVLFVFGLAGTGEFPCWGEDKPKSQLLFLVAREPVLDPFFERSVVLMLPLQGEPLIVGLVVNKPTLVPLTKLFPESPTWKNRPDNAYMGGPVDMSVPSLVFHAAKAPKQAMPLYGDVYLSFDSKLISKLMQEPKQSGELRLFLGRAQWAPEQLQGEALEGSWYSLRAEGDVIFDHDAEHLWRRLHDRAQPPSDVDYVLPRGPKGQFRGVKTSLAGK
jgi:putative transcriptional regulator